MDGYVIGGDILLIVIAGLLVWIGALLTEVVDLLQVEPLEPMHTISPEELKEGISSEKPKGKELPKQFRPASWGQIREQLENEAE